MMASTRPQLSITLYYGTFSLMSVVAADQSVDRLFPVVNVDKATALFGVLYHFPPHFASL